MSGEGAGKNEVKRRKEAVEVTDVMRVREREGELRDEREKQPKISKRVLKQGKNREMKCMESEHIFRGAHNVSVGVG